MSAVGGPAPTPIGAGVVADALGLPAPTPEQRAVIEAPPESLLVVAGAGSGKTETMTSRVVWLVANGLLEPQQVLGLTFTRKAAGELGARISRRLARLADVGLWDPPDGDAGERPVVSTYHAYAGRLVAEHGMRIGVEPDARLLGQAAAWQLAHEAVLAYDGPMDDVEAAESTVTAAVVDLAGELAEHLVGIEDVDGLLGAIVDRIDALPARRGPGRGSALPAGVRALRARARDQRLLLPIVDAYARTKRRRDSLDFADQVAIAARLAQEVPAVAALERRRYAAVLLDEFQDTSEAQLRLLRALFAAPPGPGVPVMAVGDPHQSIYAWRGAGAGTLARFPALFGAGSRRVPTLALSTSWRNDTAVLDVANAVARPLREGSRVPVERLVARPGAGPGRVSAARYLTEEDEADAVARWARAAWDGAALRPPAPSAEDPADGAADPPPTATPPARPTGPVDPPSVAVLCRRRAQFPAVVEALQAHGLPVEVVGLGGLLTTPEVGDIVTVLTVVDHPTRGDALMRALTGARFGLGPADLDALGTWARELHRRRVAAAPAAVDPAGAGPADAPPRVAARVGPDEAPSLVEALEELPPSSWAGRDAQRLGETARGRLAELAGVLRALRASAYLPLSDLVLETERALGLDVELLSRPDVPAEAARVHVDALVEVAAEFSAAVDRPTLSGFLAWLEAAQTQERGLDLPVGTVSGHAVQVLTVHAAKGLEWDHVAVPGLVEGAFPSYRIGGSSVRGGEWAAAPPTDKGWITGLASLPYDLRGDAAELPRLPWRDVEDLADLEAALRDHAVQGGRRAVEEERRLAYVAFTRARRELHLSAHVWGTPTTPRPTSRFLADLVESPGRVETTTWAPMPPIDEPAVHPGGGRPTAAAWPPERADAAEDVVWAAARDVERAAPGTGRVPPTDVAAADLDRRIDALLAERARSTEKRGRAAGIDPGYLSASDVVALARNPGRFAAGLRRPVPEPPSAQVRAGVAFHAWIEAYYRRPGELDLLTASDEPGADPASSPDDAELDRMRRHFLASPWADRSPLDLETSVETVIDGVPIRGRLDAVFPDRGGGVVIVDWKTGRAPAGGERDARAWQLGLYRYAYRRLTGLPPEKVRAVFFHAADGRTEEPPLPSDEELQAALADLLRFDERSG
ncbi:ATP-dependent helicase [Agilicoccus flavus]|uniref:ATP-dependent helicase n=1 Tax=Agilicoccus flavus TaxID=2775968 RepID=UPI001CF6C152|nr:ATP-dependent DNA helicase [Agilicoccus flavus]